jgi:protein TonB
LLTLPYKNKRNLSIAETILLSVLFHAAFLAYIPSQNLNQISKSVELDIDILINEPEPIIEPIPEPIIEPIPEPIIEPIPELKRKVTQSSRLETITQTEIKAQPNDFVIKKKRESYSAILNKAIAKQKNYPRIATMRGWQGKTIIDLKIDGQGNLINSKIKQKSGFKILDKEGMAMVKRASPFPKPPKELESLGSFNVTVPISFSLQD